MLYELLMEFEILAYMEARLVFTARQIIGSERYCDWRRNKDAFMQSGIIERVGRVGTQGRHVRRILQVGLPAGDAAELTTRAYCSCLIDMLPIYNIQQYFHL